MNKIDESVREAEQKLKEAENTGQNVIQHFFHLNIS